MGFSNFGFAFLEPPTHPPAMATPQPIFTHIKLIKQITFIKNYHFVKHSTQNIDDGFNYFEKTLYASNFNRLSNTRWSLIIQNTFYVLRCNVGKKFNFSPKVRVKTVFLVWLLIVLQERVFLRSITFYLKYYSSIAMCV